MISKHKEKDKLMKDVFLRLLHKKITKTDVNKISFAIIVISFQ